MDYLDPIRTSRNGRPMWLWPDGKTLPVVSGGDGLEDAPTPPAPVPPAPPTPPAPPAPPAEPEFPANTPVAEMTAPQQVAYWKHQSRKHEARATERADYDAIKAKAEQYDALANASKTEQERAIEAARTEATEQVRKEERTNSSIRIVDAEMRAAAAGRIPVEQLKVILDPIDRTKFLTADGEVDDEKITAFIAGIAPAADKGGRFPDLGQGRRQSGPATPSIQSGRDLYRERHARKTTTT